MSLSIARCAAVAAAALLAAGAANAERNCFLSIDWQGWKSPSPDVLYLKVNMHDVYKVELSGGGSSQLQNPSVHLVSIVRGGNTICSAIDLDLKVSDNGFITPLIAKTLTKLTPDEIAAIPKKFRP
jgi:hypothetical protein